MSVFGLGSFESSPGDRFPGLVVDRAVLDLRPYFGAQATTAELLGRWDASLDRLTEIAAVKLSQTIALDDLRPLPPVQPMGQLFCAGANYHRHVAEITASMGMEGGALESADRSPFVFAMPSSAASGARDEIVLWGPGVQHDWELELGVVIGRRARNVPSAAAMECVAGFLICNDVSTRDLMVREDLPLTDLLSSKGRPGFFPMGPYFVPRRFVPDYRRLRITLRVDGQLMQDELVAAIDFGIEELVSYTSTVAELWPGDVVLSGSPSGNAGHHGNRWLRPGDLLEGEVEGLGALQNRCVAIGCSRLEAGWSR